MTTIISRLFHPAQTARNAATSLRDDGFAAQDILIVTPSEEGAFDKDAALSAIAAMGVPSEDASVYGAAIDQGAGLVVVRAPFGTALTAIRMLDAYNPVAVDVAHPELYMRARPTGSAAHSDNPAPFSRALGLPVLSSDPALLSRLLGLPVLSRRPARTTLAPSRPTFPVRMIREAAPLSRLLGLPVLFRHPAPFSALLRLPVLIHDRPRE